MKLSRLAATPLALLALSQAAFAQAPAADVYKPQSNQPFRFAGDTLARYEWTKDLVGADGIPTDESRWRLSARPRIEATIGPVQLGVGGAFNYSEDENDKDANGEYPALIRDNYRSRDARLDLAWAKVTLGPVVAQGGRFLMPIPLTEMIWDRDLRPQGGALSLNFGNSQSAARFSVYGIYATGSHVFEDKSEMYGGAGEISFGRVGQGTFDVTGAYLEFKDLNKLEPPIRRQNTKIAGLIIGDYHIFDVVGRLSHGGQVPTQFVVDYCWNTAIDTNNKGLWIAAVLGAIGVSPAQLEYTYAKVDRDATVAAFNTDDFLWGTGWEGHRGDLGVSTHGKNSLHAIAQWQRFKDNPDPVISQQWVKRYRIEWRTTF
jgi:hypothetical protein